MDWLPNIAVGGRILIIFIDIRQCLCQLHAWQTLTDRIGNITQLVRPSEISNPLKLFAAIMSTDRQRAMRYGLA